MIRHQPRYRRTDTLLTYTTLFRSQGGDLSRRFVEDRAGQAIAIVGEDHRDIRRAWLRRNRRSRRFRDVANPLVDDPGNLGIDADRAGTNGCDPARDGVQRGDACAADEFSGALFFLALGFGGAGHDDRIGVVVGGGCGGEQDDGNSEERRVGKEGVRTWRSRWSSYH